MNITSIPTDSLYKFCAIFGLVLFVFGTTYPAQKALNIKLRIVSTSANIQVASKRVGFWKSDMSTLQHDISELGSKITSMNNRKDLSPSEVQDVKSQTDALSKRNEKLAKTDRNLQIQLIYLQADVNKSKALNHNLIFILVVCILSTLVGGLLMLFGFGGGIFVCKYHKILRYHRRPKQVTANSSLQPTGCFLRGLPSAELRR